MNKKQYFTNFLDQKSTIKKDPEEWLKLYIRVNTLDATKNKLELILNELKNNKHLKLTDSLYKFYNHCYNILNKKYYSGKMPGKIKL